MMWARLARVQIVAEVYYQPAGPQNHYPREHQESVRFFYWDDPADAREQALRALKSAGARVLVTSETPHGSDADQWKELGSSGYYYRGL